MSAATDNNDEIIDVTDVSVEQEARQMGWVPQDEFKGDKAKWVGATQFVEHGQKVMPILRKNNENLIRDMSALRLQVNRLTKDLDGARQDLSTYQEFHQEELTRRMKETREQILQRLETAHEENDSKAVAKLTGQLTDLSAAEQKTEQAVNGHDKDDERQPEQQLDPDFLSWAQANPKFDHDEVFTFKAMGIAAEMRKEGLQSTLKGRAWFDEVDRRLNGEAAPSRGRQKVEGSSGGRSNGSGITGRTYSDLPADAKAACDKFADKLVGENRAYKTVADFRKYYVKQLEQTGFFNQ